MLISIIIAVPTEFKNITAFLTELVKQPGKFEIIVVFGPGIDDRVPVEGDNRVKFISTACNGYEAQLNAGAAVAGGDVLFFLDPASRLPEAAILAIERNIELLPQTIGGNFHPKFKTASLLSKLLARALKWWRYRGCYFRHSGIFIRKEVYDALGGFRPDTPLPDFDLVKRMESFGPTLFLPEAIVSPRPTVGEALRWLTAPILMR